MRYEVRLASVLIAALVAVGCSDGGPLASTSRSSGGSSSANPTPVPPNDSQLRNVQHGPFVVTGLVEEGAGDRAYSLGAGPVNVWVQQTNGFGYSYWWANGRVDSDGSGQFQLVALPETATVYLQAWRDGFVQPCTAAAPALSGNVTVQLRLVRLSNISTSPSSLPAQAPGMRYIAGTIFENGPEGRRPAAGVEVSYEPVMEVPAASTITGSDGRYLLCGIPSDKAASLSAYRDNRYGFADAAPGRMDDVDFELK